VTLRSRLARLERDPVLSPRRLIIRVVRTPCGRPVDAETRAARAWEPEAELLSRAREVRPGVFLVRDDRPGGGLEAA
jgi:hypothetical protein